MNQTTSRPFASRGGSRSRRAAAAARALRSVKTLRGVSRTQQSAVAMKPFSARGEDVLKPTHGLVR